MNGRLKSEEITPAMVRASATVISDRFDLGIEMSEIIAEQILRAAFDAIDRGVS